MPSQRSFPYVYRDTSESGVIHLLRRARLRRPPPCGPGRLTIGAWLPIMLSGNPVSPRPFPKPTSLGRRLEPTHRHPDEPSESLCISWQASGMPLENKPKLLLMEFYHIVNRRVGGESTHKSASFCTHHLLVGQIFKYLITQEVFILVGGLGHPRNPWVALHTQAIHGYQAIHGWPGSAVGPEQKGCKTMILCRESHP